MNLSTPEVVVTGVGLVTCLGLDAERTWGAVRAGRCGLGPLSALESTPAVDKGGGQVEDDAGVGSSEAREVRFLRRALEEAVEQAFGAPAGRSGPGRIGIVLGTTLHGVRCAGEFLRGGDLEFLRDFLAPAVLRRALAGLTLPGGPFDGPALTTCAACSSGLSSVGLALTLLCSGELDVVIAGGYDPISEYAYAGFDSLRVVAAGPLRPFCGGREGMKVSEGYGILVLERASGAAERGAGALACIRGYGESSDAHHLTLPHPDGEGAARAMEQALARADVRALEIGLIAAHATATPNNDAAEHAAFSRVFGGSLRSVPVVAFKSHVGHTLGGAGAVELILSILAMRDGVVPPTANIAAGDIEFAGLDLNPGPERPAPISLTLNTSLGFGGANTCVVAGRARGRRGLEPVPARCEVAITGIGVVLPGAVGNAAFVERLEHERGRPAPGESGRIEDAAIEHLFASRRVRRMSEYVRLTLAATALALEDAGVTGDCAFAESCAAILGTTHGSTGFAEAYYGQIVREGLAAANPVLFAEGVPNAGSAQLSLMLGLKGGCQTIIGSRTAGLDALHLAALRVGSGEWDRAIVGAAEEYSAVVDRAYVECGLGARGEWTPAFGGRGFVTGAGAVTMIIERRDAATARGGRVRGLVRRGRAGTAPAGQDGRGRAAGVVARLLGELCDGDGPAAPVLSSANGTWVDRAEAIGIRSAGGSRTVSTLYGWAPETFSVGPLAGVAATLLTGRLPGLVGGGQEAPGGRDPGARPVVFDTVCTDYAGPIAAVRVELPV